MKAVLNIDSNPKVSFEIGFEDISSIVSSLPDSDDFTAIYAAMALHPSVRVREAVAGKDKLDDSTVETLSASKDSTVLRAIVRSEAARTVLTTDRLQAIAAMDVEAAESIASWAERYENADIDVLVSSLIDHSDPQVRQALSGNSSVPKKFLKTLLKDADPRVRATAKSSLE